MVNLTDKIKIAAVGLGLLALTALPLNAQKPEADYLKKVNMENCLSRKGRSYPHFKNEKVEIYCRTKKAKRDNYTVYIEQSLYTGYCVSSQAKRYNRHFDKMNKSRR